MEANTKVELRWCDSRYRPRSTLSGGRTTQAWVRCCRADCRSGSYDGAALGFPSQKKTILTNLILLMDCSLIFSAGAHHTAAISQQEKIISGRYVELFVLALITSAYEALALEFAAAPSRASGTPLNHGSYLDCFRGIHFWPL